MKYATVILMFVGLFSLAVTGMAEVPQMITYQGHLTDDTGAPLDTTVSMTFTIYDDSTGGTPLWTESKIIDVTAGRFTTKLGTITPLEVGLFAGSERWLEIEVSGEIITPRTQLTTSPYAYRPATVDGASGGTILGGLTLQGESVKNGALDRGGDIIHEPTGAPDNGAMVALTNKADVTTVQLQASEILGYGPGGALKLSDQEGLLTVKLDGEKPAGGGELVFYDGAGGRLASLTGTKGGLGASMRMNRISGAKAVEIDAEDDRDGYGPHLEMLDVNGNTAVYICADGSPYVTNPTGGLVALDHNLGVTTARLGAAYTGDLGGYLFLYDISGNALVQINAERSASEGGTIRLYDAGYTGGPTIILDGDYDGRGRVITEVLEITGGADLSEQFNVASNQDAGMPRPGMVVTIDPEVPGQLKISASAYDPTVAGIISGAGDVEPGMLMGHQGTIADGQHPIALTGRVYCLVDASYGPVQPGDLLTTSDTPGHAMKAVDRDRAYGAVIGKAMTGLSDGQGLVLVLVNLQ